MSQSIEIGKSHGQNHIDKFKRVAGNTARALVAAPLIAGGVAGLSSITSAEADNQNIIIPGITVDSGQNSPTSGGLVNSDQMIVTQWGTDAKKNVTKIWVIKCPGQEMVCIMGKTTILPNNNYETSSVNVNQEDSLFPTQ